MVSSPIKTQDLSRIESSSPIQANAAERVESHRSKFTEQITQITPFDLAGGVRALPDRLFGTDGIRGRAGELLTAPLALHVGFWAGKVLQANVAPGGAIVIGQDSRNSSSMLTMALSAGLTASGLDVWDLGLCPTPSVAHIASTTDAIGGVMISASHNPPEDNGIKFFGATGSKLSLALQNEIEVALRGNGRSSVAFSLPQWGQHYHRRELLQNYCTSLETTLRSIEATALPLAGLRVVLDLAWGAAVELAPQTFAALGAEVICLNNRADGDRINVNCGSTHLGQLKAAVQSQAADLGFAFDGDADRVLAVDSQGRSVDGDYILYFWGDALRQQGNLPGTAIVATVMSNLGFQRAWEQQGGTLIRAAVGDQHVHAEMLQHGAMLGGEQSGHVLCRHYSVSGDGLLTALHLAALVQRSGTSLAELVEHSFQTYPQLLKNVRVEDRSRRLNWQECEPLQRAIAQAEAAMGDQGRVLVRASGTEPVIRVMVEAVSNELVNHWADTLVTVVQTHLAH